MLTTIILPPGVGHPGPVQPGLIPFPVDPLDPLESSSELRALNSYAQARCLSHLGSEKDVQFTRFSKNQPRRTQGDPKGAQGHPKGTQKESKGTPGPKGTPTEHQKSPRALKIYISNSRSTAQADVMLQSNTYSRTCC